MTLKNIGVFVDATPEGEKRIDYAATLAHQCGAHLAGIHVVSAVRPEYRSDYYVIGEKAIRASLAQRKAADRANDRHHSAADRRHGDRLVESQASISYAAIRIAG